MVDAKLQSPQKYP